MFPNDYFAPAYFPLQYWPREEASLARVGGSQVGFGRMHIIIEMMMQDDLRTRQLFDVEQWQQDEMLKTLFARQTEWNIGMEYLQKQAEASAYTVLLTEL